MMQAPRPTRWRTALAVATLAITAAACDGGTIDGQAVNTPSAATVTASAPSGSPSTPAPSGTFTWGESGEFPENLLPIIAAGNSTAVGNLTVRVLTGPFRISPGVNYVPDPDQGTATSTIDNGTQVVTVKVNPDAVWADGEPITAEDYLFTVKTQQSLDPAKGGCASLLSTTGFDQINGMQALDTKTAEFTFSTPFADWRGLFSGSSTMILAKHVVDQGSPAATCRYLTKGWPVADGIPLGAQNGPWLLTANNVDSAAKTITLVPNPKYWKAKPKLARLVHRTIDFDPASNLRDLQSQAVDAIYPQPQLDLVAQLKQLSGITTTISFGSAYEHLDFNTRDPLLRYSQVRQAIALSFDRRALADATVGKFSDQAQVLGNRLRLNTQTGYEDHSGEYATQNVAKAKQLIKSVGGKLGRDGIFTIKGKPLSFRVMTTKGNPLRDETIRVLAEQAKAAGIKLTEFANPNIFEAASTPTSLESLNFQIALFAWIGSPSISSNNPIFLTRSRGGGQNYSQGSDPAVDAYLQKVTTAASPQEQIEAANLADRRLWQRMYTLPLYQKPTLLAFRSTVSGLADNASLAGPLWNSDGISVR